MAGLRAGDLDRRLTLLVPRKVEGELNEDVVTWRDLTTVAAQYLPVSDAERTRAAEISAVIDARFRVRWSRDVAALGPAELRVKFEGRTFNVAGVKELGRREGLEISGRARAE